MRFIDDDANEVEDASGDEMCDDSGHDVDSQGTFFFLHEYVFADLGAH